MCAVGEDLEDVLGVAAVKHADPRRDEHRRAAVEHEAPHGTSVPFASRQPARLPGLTTLNRTCEIAAPPFDLDALAPSCISSPSVMPSPTLIDAHQVA